MDIIKENIQLINNSIAAKCNELGRNPKDIKVVCVTKTVGIDLIQSAIEAGIIAIGENRVQEALTKVDLLPNNIERHLIGSLQKNKVKYIENKFDLIHSVDTISLVEEMGKRGSNFNILVQVNIAGETTKKGLPPYEVIPFLKKLKGYNNITVKGLMTIGPYFANPNESRPIFRRLKELFDDIAKTNMDNVVMEELSMGMSNDYIVAIEEGATIVRIGTLIFGRR
jgi:pyridoxal phosphate enzyme (YggS family)